MNNPLKSQHPQDFFKNQYPEEFLREQHLELFSNSPHLEDILKIHHIEHQIKNQWKKLQEIHEKTFYEVFSKRTIKESYEGDSKVTILTYKQIFKFGVRLSKENEKLERKKKGT